MNEIHDALTEALRHLREALSLLAVALLPLAVVLLAAWLLSGCAAPAPEIRVVREPVRVSVPVAVPCVAPEQVPALPALTSDAALAGLTDYALVLALEEHRRRLRAAATELHARLAACAGAVPHQQPDRPPSSAERKE